MYDARGENTQAQRVNEMGAIFGGQAYESKKAPVQRPRGAARPPKARRANARQAGTLWQRKMRTLALRLPKGRVRRDRSGAPMKRG